LIAARPRRSVRAAREIWAPPRRLADAFSRRARHRASRLRTRAPARRRRAPRPMPAKGGKSAPLPPRRSCA